MDRQKQQPPPPPPPCVLGCGNMRHWSFIVPVVNIIFWTTLTLFIVMFYFAVILKFNANVEIGALFISTMATTFTIFILSVGMIAINIKLGFSVLKRDREPIRIWLLVQSTVAVVSTILILVGIYYTVENVQIKTMQHVTAEILAGALFEGLLVFSGIPVYEYYKYLRTCHRDSLPSGPVLSICA